MTVRTGIIAALAAEARVLARDARPGILITAGESLVYMSGIGPERAYAAACATIRAGAAGLVSWGVAGALVPALAPGTVLLPRCVTLHDGDRLAVDTRWRDRLESRMPAHAPGLAEPLAHSAQIVHGHAHKQRLAQAHGAIAVDMESAAVLRAAAEHGLPAIVVRVVADSWDMPIPRAPTAALDRYGRAQPWRMAAALMSAPGDLTALLRLHAAFRAALRRLHQVRDWAGPGLGLE